MCSFVCYSSVATRYPAPSSRICFFSQSLQTTEFILPVFLRPLYTSISLLYDGFGVFEDVRRGAHIPGEDDILKARLLDKVDEFVSQMAGYYDDSEAGRWAAATRKRGIWALLKVFFFGSLLNPKSLVHGDLRMGNFIFTNAIFFR